MSTLEWVAVTAALVFLLAVARAKNPVSTPFGMTTASPPRCVVTVRRASSETAMRPLIFSSEGRSSG